MCRQHAPRLQPSQGAAYDARVSFVPLPGGVHWEVERAVQLLRAYFAHPDLAASDNPEYQQVLRGTVTPATTGATQAEVGRMISGFVMLCSILLADLGDARGQSARDALDAIAAEVDQHLAGGDS